MSEQQTVTAEVWICVDECGDYAVGKDAEDARAAFENDVGALCDREGVRCVKLLVTVPLPVVAVLTGTVPQQGEANLTEVS